MPHHPDPLSLARELLEAAEKATEGPWACDEALTQYAGMLRPSQNVYANGQDARVIGSIDYWADASNAAFIALTRTAAPALAQYALEASAEVERLKAERDEAVATMTRMCGDA